MNGTLKNYFSFKELVHTSYNVDNLPSTVNHISNLLTLWFTLNTIREELGEPIYINSAYRTKEVNELVGGASRSLHMSGRAADIRCAPEHMSRLWTIIEQFDEEIGLSEKINYETFYHIAL